MKYIKKYEIINEELNLNKWRNYIIGLSIGAGMLIYNGIKINAKLAKSDKLYHNMINVINDINSVPTDKQKVYLDSIKNSIIQTTLDSDKLTKKQKDTVIKELKDIKIVMSSYKEINSFRKDGDMTAMASYLRYTDVDGSRKKVILVAEDILKKNAISLSHEMFHLIDDILGKETYYSKVIEITKLLDKDIIMKTPLGLKKVKNKVEFFITQTLKNPKNVKIKKTKEEHKKSKPLTKEEYEKLRNQIVKTLTNEVYSNQEYMTSPAELYARYTGLKHFLLKNKIIKDINQPITKKMIVDLFSEDLLSLISDDEIDFYNLIFFLNIDPTTDGETEEETNTLKKMNTIASYSRYNDDNLS